MSCSICQGQHFVVEGNRRVACRCTWVQQQLKRYPFFKNVEMDRVDTAKVRHWVSQICVNPPKERMRDILIELEEACDHEIWFLLTVLMSYHQIDQYELLDVFELVDIVYMRHPKYDSFWKIKAPVVVLWTGFNRYSTTTPERLASWVAQLWDKCRAHGQTLVLLSWLSEVPDTDAETWRQYCRNRKIDMVRLGRGATNSRRAGGIYTK